MGSTARPHDMGGKTADAIDTVDHGMAHWEKHANGFRMLLSAKGITRTCLLYTSPSPRDAHESRMPSSA